jgi:hypothetical protein
VLFLTAVSADERWAEVTTERLIGSGLSEYGLLDLQTGRAYWYPAGLNIDALLVDR